MQMIKRFMENAYVGLCTESVTTRRSSPPKLNLGTIVRHPPRIEIEHAILLFGGSGVLRITTEPSIRIAQHVEPDPRVQAVLFGGDCAYSSPGSADIQCPKDQTARIQTGTATEVILGVCLQD